jgi:uncharacterized protein (DUF427 family)
MKAIWNDIIIAESSATIVVENNHYFPVDSVKKTYLIESATTTQCPWKGTAHYYSVKINDHINTDAVWYYPQPKEAAKNIQGYMAFWKGVQVIA